MLTITSVRGVAMIIAVTLACLGAYGAWEFASRLEGGISYVVLSAPVIAAAAALIPAIAETTWRSGARIKSLLWWLVLIPAAATIYFAVAERMHHARAGLEAEQAALAAAAARARALLSTREAEAKAAQAEADKTRGWSNCGTTCLGKRETAARLTREVAEARRELLAAEKAVHAEAAIKAPPWLFPAAMYLVEFMAFWTALSGPVPGGRGPDRSKNRKATAGADAVPKRRRSRRRRAVRRRSAAKNGDAALDGSHANDNVVNFPAA